MRFFSILDIDYLSHGLLIKQSNESMKSTMVAYTKNILERVSFDPQLFCKELEKALKLLLPYEIEQLTEWLINFTIGKPELRQCLIAINK